MLRDGKLDSVSTWMYYHVSASDDHNFTVAADHSDTHSDQPLIVRTTDAGKSWTAQDPGLPRETDPSWKHVQVTFMIDSMHVIGLGDSGLMVRTSDAGNTWIRQDFPTVHVLTGIHFSDARTGIITGGAEIFTTLDGGVTWQKPLADPPYWWMTSCHSYGGGRFRVFNYDKGIIYTTNNNWKSFDSVHVAAPNDTSWGWQGLSTCQFLGNDTIIASGAKMIGTSLFTRRSRILLSTDGGVSWTELLNRFTYAWPDQVSAVGGVWLGTGWGEGMLTSFDHGKTWIDDSVAVDVPQPYQFSSMQALVLSSSKAIAVVNEPPLGYIVEFNLKKLGVEENERQIDGTHVYPNPASGLVHIESSTGAVPIYVVDVLGRQTVVSQLGADGTMHLDVSHWASGVYQVNMLYYGKMIHITNLVVVKQ